MAIERSAVYGTALSLAVTLAGCVAQAGRVTTDPAVLAAAIDESYRDRPERICSAPLSLPYDRRVDGTPVPDRSDDLRWLDGLAAAGLVVKARTTAHGTAASGPTPIDEYALTEAGRDAIDDPRRATFGGPVRFCVADVRVGAILGVSFRGDRNGVRIATVRYLPAVRARAWAKLHRTRVAMPWLSAWTNQQVSERRLQLRQTTDGWIVL